MEQMELLKEKIASAVTAMLYEDRLQCNKHLRPVVDILDRFPPDCNFYKMFEQGSDYSDYSVWLHIQNAFVYGGFGTSNKRGSGSRRFFDAVSNHLLVNASQETTDLIRDAFLQFVETDTLPSLGPKPKEKFDKVVPIWAKG